MVLSFAFIRVFLTIVNQYGENIDISLDDYFFPNADYFLICLMI